MVSIEFGTKMVLSILVIAAGLMILLVWLLPWMQKSVFANAWWSNIFPSENTENPDLENAMKCAYYRCTNGCDSNEVKSLTATWSDPQTHNDVSCADFCTTGQTICNEDSLNNPVRIDIGEKAYLAQDKLNPVFGTDCIVSSDFQLVASFGGVDWLGLIQDVLTAQFSFIFSQLTQQKISDLRFVNIESPSLIDPDSVRYTRPDCYKSITKIGSNAMSSLNLNPGKYQISISHAEAALSRFDTIFISSYQKTSSSTNTQSSTQVTSCTAQGGNCKPVCSNAEQPLGTLDCSQGGRESTGKTCCK